MICLLVNIWIVCEIYIFDIDIWFLSFSSENDAEIGTCNVQTCPVAVQESRTSQTCPVAVQESRTWLGLVLWVSRSPRRQMWSFPKKLSFLVRLIMCVLVFVLFYQIVLYSCFLFFEEGEFAVTRRNPLSDDAHYMLL